MNETDLPNEISVIKTLIGLRDEPRNVLLEKGLKPEHFGDPRTKEMLKVIFSINQKQDNMPTYKALAQAPQLSSEARELLIDTNKVYPTARTKGDAELWYNNLERLRKGRVILASASAAMEALSEESSDPDDAVLIYEKALLEVHDYAVDDTLRVGPDSNLMEAVMESLNRTKPDAIPTGFRDFDESAGGLPRGGLTVLAANSGGGKSTMAMQIAINAVRANYNACVVTLEMQKTQTTNRLMANVSEVSHTNINLCKTTSMQKARVEKAMRAWDEEQLKLGARLTVHHANNKTFSDIALQMRAMNYDIIFIDYINLLEQKDMDQNNEAAALKEITRVAKQVAGQTKAAWVILAQLNEQGIVKYSRGIAENADYLLSWTYGDAERETHIIEITQQKSRNSAGFKFNLKENFEWQQFNSVGSATENREAPGLRKRKKVKRHPTAKPMPGLDFDEDDDDE